MKEAKYCIICNKKLSTYNNTNECFHHQVDKLSPEKRFLVQSITERMRLFPLQLYGSKYSAREGFNRAIIDYETCRKDIDDLIESVLV